jgi:hypothetical protein
MSTRHSSIIRASVVPLLKTWLNLYDRNNLYSKLSDKILEVCSLTKIDFKIRTVVLVMCLFVTVLCN